jgi:hypothetical protein
MSPPERNLKFETGNLKDAEPQTKQIKNFNRKDAESAEYRKEKPLRNFANSATLR